MKRYTNRTNELALISFEDGEGQFLMRGQSIETDRVIKKMSKGITVTDATPTKKKAKQETKETNTDVKVDGFFQTEQKV